MCMYVIFVLFLFSGSTNGVPPEEWYRSAPQWNTAHPKGSGGDAVPESSSQSKTPPYARPPGNNA